MPFRIFIDEIPDHLQPLELNGEKASYLSKVLRLKPGDPVIVNNGKGVSFSGEIADVSKKKVLLRLIEKIDADYESPLKIRLIQGILKGEKMDLVVQKSVELGVAEIIPVVTERSQIRETRKLQRWRKISEEASRQCGRTIVPHIAEISLFSEVVASENASPAGIILWENSDESLSRSIESFRGVDDIKIIVGPEGGLSSSEVRSAKEAGYETAGLGKRILRAETAAVSAVSIVQYELGDIGGVSSLKV